ncbi:hypothetical protein ACFE04_002781 [Oxalis oulophora]
MGKKKLNISALFKNTYCTTNPKTLSFRATGDMFKTVNSVYLDPVLETETPPDSPWFTNGSCSSTFSTDHQSDEFDNESLEMMVRGVITASSERLFFEPGGETSSLVQESEKPNGGLEENGNVTIYAMESEDPYWDFRKSMEEMMESNDGLVKDWDCLEELLSWYLKVNGKNNHGFIIGAFVDLILNLSNSSSFKQEEEEDNNSDETTIYSSAMSSLSCSSMEDHGQIIKT